MDRWWEQLAGSSVFWAAVGGVGTAIAAVVAIITLIGLKLDSRERTRPVVVADLERPPAIRGNDGLDLVIRNSGATAARDLQVTFDPDPLIIDETHLLDSKDPKRQPRDRGPAEHLVERFSGGISVLPPGRRLRSNYYWHQNDPADPEQVRNRHPLPNRFTVHLTYRGRGRRRFTDSFTLVVEDFDDSFMQTNPSKDQLRDIRYAIDNITRRLDLMG